MRYCLRGSTRKTVMHLDSCQGRMSDAGMSRSAPKVVRLRDYVEATGEKPLVFVVSTNQALQLWLAPIGCMRCCYGMGWDGVSLEWLGSDQACSPYRCCRWELFHMERLMMATPTTLLQVPMPPQLTFTISRNLCLCATFDL